MHGKFEKREPEGQIVFYLEKGKQGHERVRFKNEKRGGRGENKLQVIRYNLKLKENYISNDSLHCYKN